MRQFDSAYDRGLAESTLALIRALRAAGHEVECPVTGSLIVDGVEIIRAEVDRIIAGSESWEDAVEWIETEWLGR